MINLGPNTRTGNFILALTLVGTPYISYLISLILSSLIITLPVFADDARLEWVVDITIALTPLLFLPISLVFLLAATAIETAIHRITLTKALSFLLVLSSGLIPLWSLAHYLNHATTQLVPLKTPLLFNIYFVLNTLTFLPIGITLFGYGWEVLQSKSE